MTWNQPGGVPGLLASNTFGQTVNRELTEIDVDNTDDTIEQIALFRDYCFLASAYLLEECHHVWLRTGNTYGLGRDHIPKSIAKPLVKLATKLNYFPYLEYNSGYTLNNWLRLNKQKEITVTNLDIYRTFMNMPSEKGFILVHIGVNQHGGRLIKSGIELLNSVEHRDREAFNDALKELRNILIFMNQEFDRINYESKPEHYNIFRTFIMGIVNQPMFPNGVIYEGCFDNKPQFYRGESGASDSILPFCDNILQITKFLPQNSNRDILRDFRS